MQNLKWKVACILSAASASEPDTAWRRAILRCVVIAALMCSGIGGNAAAEPLTFATSQSGWLPWIADDKGFFKANGADIKMEMVSSGVAASKGLMDGRFDIANMSEYAFVANRFKNPDLRIIGTVASISNVRLIGRSDLGVNELSDIAGKRVGLVQGAISQFFLGRLLGLNGISANTVTVVNKSAPDLPNALSAGVVDAIVSWEPYANLSAQAVGKNARVLALQGGQSYYFTIATKAELIERNGDALVGMLRGLIDASNWALTNTDDAKQLLHKNLGLPLEDLDRYWDDLELDVTLSQDILFLMEAEASWRLREGLSTGDVPDFLQSIETKLLQSIDPIRVSIIRN